MKRALLFSVMILVLALPAMAGEGDLKVGVVAGQPTGATIGYHFSDMIELNGIVGFGFGYYSSLAFSAGANLLFTVYTFDIGGLEFPLSVGPQVMVNLGLNPLVDLFGVDGVVDIRFEHTFEDFPLNLFVELGLGVQYYNYEWEGYSGQIYTDDYFNFLFSGAVGARYVF